MLVYAHILVSKSVCPHSDDAYSLKIQLIFALCYDLFAKQIRNGTEHSEI